jgi:hypothetical protein
MRANNLLSIFGFIISATLAIISIIAGYNEWSYYKFIIITSTIAIPTFLIPTATQAQPLILISKINFLSWLIMNFFIQFIIFSIFYWIGSLFN